MRDSLPWGQVRIRQVYSRRGKSYCAITLPIAAMKLLKWMPGQILTYYPTKRGGLGFVLATDLLMGLGDFDPSVGEREARGEEWKGPRENSYQERSVEVDDTVAGWQASLSEDRRARQQPARKRRK